MLRRRTARWILVVATALVASLATTAPAQATAVAACPAIYPVPAYCSRPHVTTPTASVQHIGWTYLNLNYCPAGAFCTAIYRDSTPAWHWTGTRWTQSSLRQGWVYVYPYTGSWRWAWTQDSGWVAISGGRFELRSF